MCEPCSGGTLRRGQKVRAVARSAVLVPLLPVWARLYQDFSSQLYQRVWCRVPICKKLKNRRIAAARERAYGQILAMLRLNRCARKRRKKGERKEEERKES